MTNVTPLFAIPGGPELLLILLLAVLLFGSRLPKVAHSMGASIGEFRKGREESDAKLTNGENV